MWDLFDLGPLFSSGIQAYLDVALARAVQWFQASGGSVFLGEPGSAVFQLRARHGLQANMPADAVVHVGEGIAGVVAASGTARIVDDPKRDLDTHGREGSPIISAMIVPLLNHELKVFGVMNIARTVGEQQFEQSDLEQAELMATQMSLAVQNAQMVDAMTSSMTEMRHMNDKLTAVLDSVAGGILVVDPVGQVVNQNRIAADLLYWAAQPPQDLITLRGEIAKAINHLAECPHDKPVELRCHDAASARSWVLVSVPLASGGGVISIREVTDIENRERELSRVKRLAEIGQMTAAIAHEIRNPLTGIRSAAQTVRQYPDLADDLLGMIDDEVDRLNQLCEDFLDFAKPMHVESKPSILAQTIRRVVKLVQPEFDQKGVLLVVEAEDDEQSVWLDPRRMEQVILNLLRNALHASKAGATVQIRAQAEQFTVEDEGVGIPKDQQPKLFSPFFTTKSDGTGLGLCSVRKIIDAHGGTITVESEVQKGSRFTVDLSRRVA